MTRDPGDNHVGALAFAATADDLFTHDRGHLRDGLARHGVRVATPDKFLTAAFESDPQGLLGRLELQASTWAGGHPIEQLTNAIDPAGTPAFAAKIREHLSAEPRPTFPGPSPLIDRAR